MDWQSIIKEIGFVGILSGFVTWLMKELGKFYIDRKIKSYEYELAEKSKDIDRQLNFSIENYKKSLELIYFKASKLHDERLKIISDLYEKIVTLDSAMHNMTQLWKLGSADAELDKKNENARIELASKSYIDFQEFYLKRKIFFKKSTCILIDKINSDYFDSYWDYTYKNRFGGGDFEFNFKLAKKAGEKVKEEIPPVLESIENEFRIVIGAEE